MAAAIRAMAPPSPQGDLAAHYEACFREHGRTPRGVDWPNAADLATRFEVMLGVIDPALARPQLVDLGCGPGLLLDHLQATGRLDRIDYTGIELSEPMLAAARAHWPDRRFLRRDILADPLEPLSCDYVFLNGVLTEKRSASKADMAAYATELLAAAFAAARRGIAFNVMSTLVDWQRDDLFHWGVDEMMQALAPRLSRHIAVRADYGLYEYTAYVRRQPLAGAAT